MENRVLIGCLAMLFLTSVFLTGGDLGATEAPTVPKKNTRAQVSASQGKTSGVQRAERPKRVARPQKGDMKPMPPLTDARFSAEVPLIQLISEAKARLSKERVRYFSAQGGLSASRELKLALADLKTGRIRVVSGVEEKHNLILKETDVLYDLNWWNGFNSSIDIVEPEHTAVVALLYAVDPRGKGALRRDAILYTPYSSALLQPELVEAGRRYLTHKIAEARLDLRHVTSRADNGVGLHRAPAFTDDDYLNLILVEHMDPDAFRAITSDQTVLGPDREEQLIRLARRILVIVGTNQEDAYRFTGNYASARGLTQFTPVGMKVVWNRYTEADISRDFLEATADHLSAIKAEICLLDHYLAAMTRAYPKLAGSGGEKYAAGACYNGGPRNVLYGLKNFGVAWLHPQRRNIELSSKGSLTRKERRELEWLKRFRNHETFIYLNKIHAIEKLQPKLAWPEESVQTGSGDAPVAQRWDAESPGALVQ